MLAQSANYTVYLTTVTATAKEISAPLFVNPQLGKQHFTEYLQPTDEFKLTFNGVQQLMGMLGPRQNLCCIRCRNSAKCIMTLSLPSARTMDTVDDLIGFDAVSCAVRIT